MSGVQSIATSESTDHARMTRPKSKQANLASPDQSGQQPVLDTPSPVVSRSDARGHASVPSLATSASWGASGRNQLVCTHQQQHALRVAADFVTTEQLFNLLFSFSAQPEVVDPPSARPSLEADPAVAHNLAVHAAAVADVADAQANLLCTQEAARADDRRIRAQDHSARAAAGKLQDKLKAVRACQAVGLATQRALDLQAAEVAAVNEAASVDAARIANASAALRSSCVDDVRLHRAVVACLSAPTSPVVPIILAQFHVPTGTSFKVWLIELKVVVVGVLDMGNFSLSLVTFMRNVTASLINRFTSILLCSG